MDQKNPRCQQSFQKSTFLPPPFEYVIRRFLKDVLRRFYGGNKTVYFLICTSFDFFFFRFVLEVFFPQDKETVMASRFFFFVLSFFLSFFLSFHFFYFFFYFFRFFPIFSNLFFFPFFIFFLSFFFFFFFFIKKKRKGWKGL